MSRRFGRRASRPAEPRPLARSSGLALVVGLTVALPLAGCGLKTLAHPMGLGEQRAAAREVSPVDPLREARERAIASPAEPYWAYRLGELYVAADSLPRAEATLERAVAQHPAYPPALALLSKLYFKSGRHEDAVRLLEGARSDPARFPDGFPAELLAGLALHYEALGRHALAAQTLAAVPRAQGGSIGVYVKLRGDSPDSAANLAVASVRDQPKSAASQNNYGIVRLRAGDPTAAAKAFERAIELDPTLPGPYYNLAILEKFYRLDDAAAERWYRQYRQRATDDPDGLAQAFEKNEAKPVAEHKEENP